MPTMSTPTPQTFCPAPATAQKREGYENTVGTSSGCPLTNCPFKVGDLTLCPNILARTLTAGPQGFRAFPSQTFIPLCFPTTGKPCFHLNCNLEPFSSVLTHSRAGEGRNGPEAIPTVHDKSSSSACSGQCHCLRAAEIGCRIPQGVVQKHNVKECGV